MGREIGRMSFGATRSWKGWGRLLSCFQNSKEILTLWLELTHSFHFKPLPTVLRGQQVLLKERKAGEVWERCWGHVRDGAVRGGVSSHEEMHLEMMGHLDSLDLGQTQPYQFRHHWGDKEWMGNEATIQARHWPHQWSGDHYALPCHPQAADLCRIRTLYFSAVGPPSVIIRAPMSPVTTASSQLWPSILWSKKLTQTTRGSVLVLHFRGYSSSLLGPVCLGVAAWQRQRVVGDIHAQW